MTPYANAGGDSGVKAYEYDAESITVEFTTGAKYLYTYGVTGSIAVEEMKTLADSGQGLNEYINRVVKKRYARKL